MATREGLILANMLGCNTVIAESDSTQIIEACTGQEAWRNEAAAIFADCVDLASSIGSVKFQHCRREANKTTHELARVCFLNKDSYNWDDEPPNFWLNNLRYDVTFVGDQ